MDVPEVQRGDGELESVNQDGPAEPSFLAGNKVQMSVTTKDWSATESAWKKCRMHEGF